MQLTVNWSLHAGTGLGRGALWHVFYRVYIEISVAVCFVIFVVFKYSVTYFYCRYIRMSGLFWHIAAYSQGCLFFVCYIVDLVLCYVLFVCTASPVLFLPQLSAEIKSSQKPASIICHIAQWQNLFNITIMCPTSSHLSLCFWSN